MAKKTILIIIMTAIMLIGLTSASLLFPDQTIVIKKVNTQNILVINLTSDLANDTITLTPNCNHTNCTYTETPQI